MARSVLARTDEADLSAAVTGHLGPDAPPDVDGVVFVCVAWRTGSEVDLETSQFKLQATNRIDRQSEAVEKVLQAVANLLQRE